MINSNFSQHLHWDYLISLSDDLNTISRYIEITPDNFGTYSIELTRLFLSACAEVDVVLKRLCNDFFEPNENAGNMNGYRQVVKAKLPELISERVFLFSGRLDMVPFENWEGETNPDWWRHHNDVKHERDHYYQEASLENSLRAISGLLVVCIHYYKFKLARNSKNPLNHWKALKRLKSHPKILSLLSVHYPTLIAG